METINRKKLLNRAKEQRGAILQDLKKQIEGFSAAGGAVSYCSALEALNDCARFAAQVASVEELESSRPMA